MEVSGTQLATLAFDATIEGPVRPGSPLETSGQLVAPESWSPITDLALTTGDQVFEGAGVPIYVVDTRDAAPSALLAYCGRSVTFQVTVGAQMADDSHVEGSTNVITAPVRCD